MTTYAPDVQGAVYQILSDAALPSVGSITDHKISDPKKEDYPHVQIGDWLSLPDDVQCADGSEEFLTLHVWSRQRGQTEIKTIIGAIDAALDGVALLVAGLASCHCQIDRARIVEDPDGLTLHGLVTLRIHCRKG